MPFTSFREPIILTEEELNYLERLSRSRNTKRVISERAKVIILSNQGESDSFIARKLGISRHVVMRTINRVLKIGIHDGLYDLPGRGKQKIISTEARTWIIGLYCRKPLDFGFPHEIWTQRLLQKYIQEHSIEEGYPEVSNISQGTISKICNASSIKPFKMHSYIQKRDPEFKEKAAIVLHTYEEANVLKVKEKEGEEPDTFILSFDEKSGIQVIDNRYPDLMPIPGQYPYIYRDYEYIRNGTVCLQAAMDLVTGYIHYNVTEKNNSSVFVDFLKNVDKQYPINVKIKIILDNLKVHSSKETMEYLKSIPNRFEFIFTPKHASWINIIECFFSKTTRSVLKGIRVKSKEEIKNRLSQYIDSLNEEPVIFKWTYKMDANPSGVVLV